MNAKVPDPIHRLGPRWEPSGVVLAVWAPQARAVAVELIEPGRTVPMTASQGLWTAELGTVADGTHYALRVDGGPRLLDPLARRIDTLDGHLVGALVQPRAPEAARPHVPWAHTVIYEAHVRGLTRLHPEVPPELRGTYAGLAHPAVVEHLQSLGVTTLQLLPVQHHQTEPDLTARGLVNYWGYNPVGWAAPHPAYAPPGVDAVTAFRDMVEALHRAGIEVILDVVFNHTAEGGADGPLLHLRGLGDEAWYRHTEDGYDDLSGCGNTPDLFQPQVAGAVRDALRAWVDELGVDGFRFDLAAALVRGPDGALDSDAPLLHLIAEDPVLSQVKCIAEPWDLRGVAQGWFPPGWAELDGRFRDTVRSLWRGDRVPLGEVATRLSGSVDLFGSRGPSARVAFVTSHDGFTLSDLCSYAERHNHANGEHNRDGHRDTRSMNHGVEGPTDDPRILATRDEHRRALFLTLALAVGTPLISHGDELGRTQRGNNNAYCHDDALTWVDWGPRPRDVAFHAFARACLRARQAWPALTPERFLHPARTRWLRADGTEITRAGWQDPALDVLVLHHLGTDEIVIALNRGRRPVDLVLPGAWRVEISSLPSGSPVRLLGRSIAMLVRP